jgi:DNA-binding CsgD family transcriptional regulator
VVTVALGGSTARPALHGRQSECTALDRLLAEVRADHSQVLLMSGDAGVGKTALLDYLADRAHDCRILRAVGVESELELAFAGLHQLCAPMLGQVERLPPPQRDALTTAFGLSNGAPPDGFLVGLAVLSLLAEFAEQQPLVCLVDDLQWLDDASTVTLTFVARRLLAEPIGLVFAGRPTAEVHGLRGLPELTISGLRDADARALLSAALRTPIDPAVLDQIVAETDGNPLALLELPHAWNPGDLAGGFAIPGSAPVAGRMKQAFQDRLLALPSETRRLLLVAAAEPIGDLSLLGRAAGQLGIDLAAAAPAEAAGLIHLGARVRFRHPLVRSTAYGSASLDDRLRAHGALSAVIDPALEPDRHAWHRAQSASGPDEDVAAELERCAGRAQARGGLSAAAAFRRRAMDLTPDPQRRAGRALAAAQTKLQAGATFDAMTLLETATSGQLDEVQLATAALVRGQLAFVSRHSQDAPPLLLAAARRWEQLSPATARETYLDAIAAALFVGRLSTDAGLTEVAAAARGASTASERPEDLLLDGVATIIADGYEPGTPRLKRAVAAFRTENLEPAQALRWLWLATHAAHDIWDSDSWEALCERHIRLARQAGALAILPIALSARVGLHLFAGELGPAESLVNEISAVSEATGNLLPPYGAIALAAWRGREPEVTALAGSTLARAVERGEGMGLTLVHHAQAVLYNGLGRYREAFVAAEKGAANPLELAFSTWSLIQLIEAAIRCGEPEAAARALERLIRTTGPSGTDWALGVEARSRALLAEGATADRHYREAIDRLSAARLQLESARAQLLYGEWLQQEGRRDDARKQLRAAHTAFSAMGAEAFAARARRELTATGGKARAQTIGITSRLTAQEAQIARLVAAGRTNPEIGAELFLSPRTVEWHLGKVYAKLGVSSRRQLRSALPEVPVPAAAR